MVDGTPQSSSIETGAAAAGASELFKGPDLAAPEANVVAAATTAQPASFIAQGSEGKFDIPEALPVEDPPPPAESGYIPAEDPKYQAGAEAIRQRQEQNKGAGAEVTEPPTAADPTLAESARGGAGLAALRDEIAAEEKAAAAVEPPEAGTDDEGKGSIPQGMAAEDREMRQQNADGSRDGTPETRTAMPIATSGGETAAPATQPDINSDTYKNTSDKDLDNYWTLLNKQKLDGTIDEKGKAQLNAIEQQQKLRRESAAAAEPAASGVADGVPPIVEASDQDLSFERGKERVATSDSATDGGGR